MVRSARWLQLVMIIALLVGILPPAVSPATATTVSRPDGTVVHADGSAGVNDLSFASARPNTTLTFGSRPFQLFIPLIQTSTPPVDTATLVLNPGTGGTVRVLGGRISATFDSAAITQSLRIQLSSLTAPQVTTTGLAVGGPTLSLDLRSVRDGATLSRLPPTVVLGPPTPFLPATADVTPSITLAVQYTAADIWGLDEHTLALYTRDGPDAPWRRVPSAVIPDQHVLIAQVEQGGEYVPMGRLAVVTMSQANPRLALDPDDNVGWAVWPPVGTIHEVTYNVQLATAVKQRFADAGCAVDVLITRDTTPYVSRALRASSIQGFGSDVAVTLAFNAYTGHPWGVSGDGGPVAYARSGHGSDSTLAQELLDEVFNYTTRRTTRPILARGNPPYPTYAEFDGLTATYAHLETLYLDHNYDWPIINTGFDKVADGVYAGLARELTTRGALCTPPGSPGPVPPPLPPRPSAEQIQRWRDLGDQNYQRYGADPVSFSTGNHILHRSLIRLPGRGGLDLNLTLTYNSQDQRGDILGYGWTFPYNIRLQRYADESVGVTLADGRTYLYEWNGSGYTPPAGVFDRLARNADTWTLTSRDNEQTWSFQSTVTGLGVLKEWRDRRGNTLTFDHDLSGEDAWKTGNPVPRPPLTAIHDVTGRTVTVDHDSQGRITAFVLPDSRRFDLAYDGQGDLVSITDANTPVRGTYRYAYDERHRVVQQWDPEAIPFLTNVYDDRDRVVEQVDANGIHSFLSYDPIARTTTFTDNGGFKHVYAYDSLNRVTGETNPLLQTAHTEYDASYNITRRVDAQNNATTYGYDARGNLIERTDPLASCSAVPYSQDVTRWTYNAENLVSSRTDALGNQWTYTYDGAGNLVRAVAPIGATSATYDAWGQVTSLTDANSHTTHYRYDTYGNRIETTDAASGVSSSTFDITGRELSYTDANHHSVSFSYNGNDQIVTITDPKGNATTFAYDRNNLLLSTTDRNGVTREFRYDKNLKLIAGRDHPAGAWQTYTYDPLYRRIATTDRLGYTTSYTYDNAGRLTALTDPTGAQTRYGYDADGHLTDVTDVIGGKTHLDYDAVGRLVSQTDAAGNVTTSCYNAEDRLVQTSGPRTGEVYGFGYDPLGRLISLTDPQGTTRQMVYDPAGNRTAEITPLGYRTDYGYDSLNRISEVARPALPDGSRPTTSVGYDAVGNTTTITSPRGFATRMAYDKNDKLVTLTDSLSGKTSYTYDPEDRPLSVTDANGNTATTIYDLVGNPLSVSNGLGETTRLAYDPAYNVVRSVDPLGHPTTYDYDQLHRLIRTTDPLGNATTYQRDALGRVTGVLDAEGRTTGYSFDPLGRLLAVTDALKGATRYEYDQAGNLAGITDANSHTTRFAFNLLNQMTGEINPLGKTWRYAYDPDGRLNQRVDALGRATSYEYDSNAHLVGVQYGAPAGEQPPLLFQYDLAGNQVQMCDGLGCQQTSYDPLDRPVSTTDWQGRTVGHSYDGVGNQVALTYPGGRPLRYEYDAANRLAGVTDPHGATSVYQRNANGQVTGIRQPNGTLSSYSYDPASRLTSIDNRQEGVAKPQSAYAYSLDRVGNRTQVVETRAAFDGSNQTVTLTHDYNYDALNRLASATTNTPASSSAYSFDPVGNRTAKTGTALAPDPGLPTLPVRPNPVSEQSSYNAANQLTQSGDTALGYDDNGNRHSETRTLPNGQTETTDYRYDREDRLVGVTKRTGDSVTMQAVYEYDGYGRRARKTVTYPGDSSRNQRITYSYDGLEIIGAAIEGGGKTRDLAFYLAPSPLTGLRRPYAMEDLSSHTRYWFQSDGLDSVVALTDAQGKLTAPMLYDEYGRNLAGDAAFQLFTYTAQDYDPETGLLHFYARYYDPARGVWLSQDAYRGEIAAPGTMHRYGYVGGNPATWVDAYGHFWGIVAVVAVVFVGALILSPTPVYAPAPDDQPGNIQELTQQYEKEHQEAKDSFVNQWVYPYVDISDDFNKFVSTGDPWSGAKAAFNVALTASMVKGIGGLANGLRRCLFKETEKVVAKELSEVLVKQGIKEVGVNSAKIGYLLSETGGKAPGFNALGYTIENAGALENLLTGMAKETTSLVAKETTSYGTKYEITRVVTGPNGVTGRVTTTWQVDQGSNILRFITGWVEVFK